MNFFKKTLCFIISAGIVCSFSACGKNNKNNTNSTLSTVSEEEKPPINNEFTIGNLTVLQIKDILDKTVLEDGLVLEKSEDNTDKEYHSITYVIKDSKGKKQATVSANSDLENKAASFSVSWDYNKATAELNTSLAKASKTLVTSVWPDYSEEYMGYVSKNVSFETSYLNAFRNENMTYTANAVSGFISAGMSSGKVTFTVVYANLVENV